MATGKFTRILLIFLQGIWCAGISYAQSDEQRALVAMRRIGHEILLQSGDSISRVMPVSNQSGRYGISFANSFRFDADRLVTTIDRVLRGSRIAISYLVEIEQCGTGTIIYSYEIRDSVRRSEIPCLKRVPPKDCYRLFITLPDKLASFTAIGGTISARREDATSGRQPIIAVSVLSLFVFIGSIAWFRKKKEATANDDPDALCIGGYRFDKKKMLLWYGGKRTELSGKEADLLILLYAHRNTTLTREHLLKVVWGDEGDYIGRTPDVFVSKLRKKLEADPGVKIVNIRGVGYRLIMS